MQPRIAVYSPAKSPDDPNPSGERTIVRHLLTALRLAGYAPEVPSDLRLLEVDGDSERQTALATQAAAEASRLIEHYRHAPPDLWYTYHCYYKCPDLIGPVVSKALGIPYIIQQPSLSPRREIGPWAGFAKACHEAISTADLLFWTTHRDLGALEDAGLAAKLVRLPPIVTANATPRHLPSRSPLNLLTVAMMRTGDKLESYRRLAAGLERLDAPWRLRVVGDGPAQEEVHWLFRAFGDAVTWLGALSHDDIEEEYASADILVWPGVGEGIGMVYLEAQGAGVPVVAEDHPAQRDVVVGRLTSPGNPVDFAARIRAVAAERESQSRTARARIMARHTPGAVSGILRNELGRLIK
ncbi:MAG: glycosyltransferase family 4 protein [Pseudomonadota bacterium]